MPTEIEPGTRLLVIDANGFKFPATATTGIERGDRFPIVWIEFDDEQNRDGDPLPWPADAVEVAP